MKQNRVNNELYYRELYDNTYARIFDLNSKTRIEKLISMYRERKALVERRTTLSSRLDIKSDVRKRLAPNLESLIEEATFTMKFLDPVVEEVSNFIQTSAEIMRDKRRTDLTDRTLFLLRRSFFSANFSLYTIEDGEAILYFAHHQGCGIYNPFFGYSSYVGTWGNSNGPSTISGNFVLPNKSVAELKIFMTRFKLDDLNLTTSSHSANGRSYLGINPKDYTCLNETQREFAEAVYGSGDAFVESMKMIKRNEVKIDVLSSVAVKEDVENVASMKLRTAQYGNKQFDHLDENAFCLAHRLENTYDFSTPYPPEYRHSGFNKVRIVIKRDHVRM